MSQPRILFVEDDTFLASIYAQKLEAQGMTVVLATNGEDGLKNIEKQLPHLMVLDLMMPRMDGFRVLEQLNEKKLIKDIPVLVFSNLSQKEDIERCLALGASAYLIKAHTLPHEFVNKVKELLNS